jgi:AraC-like DNA-binding protein
LWQNRSVLLDKLLTNLTVRVAPFALCELQTGWRMHLPRPREVTIHFVLDGDGAVSEPSGRTHALSRCWMAVVPQDTHHALEVGDVAHEQRVPALPAEGEFARIAAGTVADISVACGVVRVGYGESIGLFDHLHDVLTVDLSESEAVRHAFEGILAEQASDRPGSGAMVSALMTQCLVAMLRQMCSGDSCPFPWLTALDDPRLGRALDQILVHPEARHTVGSLAEVAAMSRSAFAERFTGAFGQPPMSLLRQVRMEQAASWLRGGTTLSLDEVADKVGFSSRSHFSRTFKEHYGVSPAAYRRQ